eukprot:TRINITY_DN27266_c0_g1_i1.p1 TRINITY_DN27266_c0_g1~~TRINITY_DN27266_c0_g1_i1.p1  ORF type:complete len:736 (-),score=127.90 TRINITY_DN27266_c0_g1_i1:15-2222(-)
MNEGYPVSRCEEAADVLGYVDAVPASELDEEGDDFSDSASEAPTAASLTVREPDEAELDGELLIDAAAVHAAQEAITVDVPWKPAACGEKRDVDQLPDAPKPRKKKTLDPAALAMRRVSLRLRAERKAARKKRKREKARASKRRGVGVDLEEFLVRTKTRLEEKAAEAEAEASAALIAAAEATRNAPRGAGVNVRSFVSKTRDRLRAEALEKVAQAREKAKLAQAAARAAGEDLEDFRRKCEERIAQKLWSQMPQVKGGLVQLSGNPTAAPITRRRIAIVGAGPVGLWAAVLLAQKYRWSDASGGGSRLRPDAPELVVLESRPIESHCSRTDIRIALSSSTQSMLNQRTRTRRFASGMPVAEIEETLIRRWKKVASHEAKIEYGRNVEDPATLVQQGGFDCVLWCAGRRSLDESIRANLGCNVKVGDSQKVVVFQIRELGGASDAWQLGSLDLSGTAQQAGHQHSLRVMLRPGFGAGCACWLWIFGLPAEVVMECFADANPQGDAVAGAASAPKASAAAVPQATLGAALGDLVGPGPASSLQLALEALQQRIKASGVTARFVDASYWSADRSVCEVALPGGRSVPMVLLGDAVGGKPFYTGSTLNRHLWDVANMLDEVEFAYDGGPMETTYFAMHERRFQEYLRRIPEFQRSRFNATQPADLVRRNAEKPKDAAPVRLPLRLPSPLASPKVSMSPPRSSSSSMSKTPSLPALHSGRSVLAAVEAAARSASQEVLA